MEPGEDFEEEEEVPAKEEEEEEQERTEEAAPLDVGEEEAPTMEEDMGVGAARHPELHPLGVGCGGQASPSATDGGGEGGSCNRPQRLNFINIKCST